MRQERSYSGNLHNIGKQNEDVIINYLIKEYGEDYKDVREEKEYQDDEVDFIINGKGIEIKGDKYISSKGNFFFETQRINHYSKEYPQSLGWGWKSEADLLIIRNWETEETFIFNFNELRTRVGELVSNWSNNRLTLTVVETDQVKTTIGILIPMRHLRDLYDYKVIE